MKRRPAMTLVEVLAALAILVVLSAGVVGFFFGVSARRDELARLAAQQRDTAALFDRLESALMGAVALAPDGSAGIRGDERSITIVTRLVTPALGGKATVADAATLAFEFEESLATCDCTLTPLIAGADPLTEPILRHVERLRFRYLRGRDWSSSFDSLSAGGLPAAVEVSLWLEPRAGASELPGEPRAPAEQAGFDAPLPAADDPFSLGAPGMPPEPEDTPWIPREPDHVRILVVPDAPAVGWGGPQS